MHGSRKGFDTPREIEGTGLLRERAAGREQQTFQSLVVGKKDMGGRSGGRALAAHEEVDKSAPDEATTLSQLIQGRGCGITGSRGKLYGDMACQNSRPWIARTMAV